VVDVKVVVSVVDDEGGGGGVDADKFVGYGCGDGGIDVV